MQIPLAMADTVETSPASGTLFAKGRGSTLGTNFVGLGSYATVWLAVVGGWGDINGWNLQYKQVECPRETEHFLSGPRRQFTGLDKPYPSGIHRQYPFTQVAWVALLPILCWLSIHLHLLPRLDFPRNNNPARHHHLSRQPPTSTSQWQTRQDPSAWWPWRSYFLLESVSSIPLYTLRGRDNVVWLTYFFFLVHTAWLKHGFLSYQSALSCILHLAGILVCTFRLHTDTSAIPFLSYPFAQSLSRS